MPRGGSFKTRLISPALGLLAVALVLVFAFGSHLYRQIELKTLDMRFGARPPAQSPALVHVDIDDGAISSWGRWPWPRARHAQLVRILNELGAQAVLFDVEFPSPSDPQDDNALAAALRETGFAFLPFRLEIGPEAEEGELDRRIREVLSGDFELDAAEIARRLSVPASAVDAKLATLKQSVAREAGREILRRTGRLTEQALFERLLPKSDPAVETAERKIVRGAVDYCLATERIFRVSSIPLGAGGFQEASGISPPIATFAQGAVGFGASNAPPDAEDGVIRHATLLFRQDGRLLPHLSLVGACRALGATMDNVDVVPGVQVVIRPSNDAAARSRAPVTIPVDGRGRVIVNWAGSRGADWPDIFTHVSFGSFLELQALRGDLDSNDDVFRNADPLVDGRWTSVHDEIAKLERRIRNGDRHPDAVKVPVTVSYEEVRKALDGLRAIQRKVEGDIVAELTKETTKHSEEELKKLSISRREVVEMMKHDLKIIPEVWKARGRLSAREKNLRERLAAIVRGRLCIVGMTASASTDIKPTPTHALFPAVGVHSAVINSILQRSFIREAPRWVNVAIIALVGLAVSFIAEYFSTRPAALLSAGVVAGWVAAAWALFAFANVWVEMAGPVTAGVLAYAAITAWRQLTEERQKRHIRNVFQHYLAPTVVEQVLRNPDSLKLGGARKELTVFFSDVAGFTPIAETMEPEELVTLLNDYLSEMSEVVLESKGYINKYEGDAIMAVFGAPLADPEHAAAACRVALESQRRLKEFREKLAREKRPIIRARIGINSGVMIVGNMGSRKLFDYTVMGDNVNIGARLETANKNFGTEIVIGENTFHLVKDVFETRRLGLVAVKGRTRPVGAYELISEKGQCPPVIAKLLPHYGEGLAAYAEQKWDEAQAAFTRCLEIHPNDGPSRAYLTRCIELSRAAQVEHWDGTFTLEK